VLGKVFGLYRAVLVVAAGLLTGVGCSSGGAGSVPARSTEQVAAQRPQAVGNTLPAPTLATPAFPAVCSFATGAFGQVLKNGITCNLPEPGSSASIQVPLPKYLYSDPIQSDCSTANLVAVVNQGTDTYGTPSNPIVPEATVYATVPRIAYLVNGHAENNRSRSIQFDLITSGKFFTMRLFSSHGPGRKIALNNRGVPYDCKSGIALGAN